MTNTQRIYISKTKSLQRIAQYRRDIAELRYELAKAVVQNITAEITDEPFRFVVQNKYNAKTAVFIEFDKAVEYINDEINRIDEYIYNEELYIKELEGWLSEINYIDNGEW